jgi:hypothetical protein
MRRHGANDVGLVLEPGNAGVVSVPDEFSLIVPIENSLIGV